MATKHFIDTARQIRMRNIFWAVK